MISVTTILFSSFKLAYQLLKLTFLSTTYPNITEPFPHAAEHKVPSGDQVIFSGDPQSILLNEYVHPVLSHNFIIPYAPTAKYYPFGLHDTDVTT
jgi:hypothetical protein